MTDVRRAGPGDEAAVAELVNAYSQRLYGEGELTAAEVAHWFREPDVEAWLARSTYADLGRHAEGTQLWIDLRGAPDAALLAAVEARAREVAAPGAVLRTVVPDADDTLRAFFAERGYRRVRSSYTMRIELDGAPRPPAWPDGVAVRAAREQDARAVYAAYAEAFADHWDFHVEPFEEWWRSHRAKPGFDLSLWFLAEAGGAVAGVCLCRPHFSGEPDAGWVDELGVRRPWRGRGLGLALLRQAFAAFWERGRARVELAVDAENLSGAVRLYERAGMAVVRRRDTLEKPL